MSANVWISMEARGFEPAREPEVRAAMVALLEAESLLDEFVDRSGRAPIGTLELVAGGCLLRAGSCRAVGISRSGPFGERMSAELAARVAAAGGPDARCRFLQVDADGSWEPMPAQAQLLARVQHYVENRLAQEVEGERGRHLAPHVPALAALYPDLPAWEQREELAHLLMDHAERAEVRPLLLNLLGAPPSSTAGTSRHMTQAFVLGVLDGHDGSSLAYERDPALVARLAARVSAGSSLAEARALEGPAGAGPLGELAWTGRYEPFHPTDEHLDWSAQAFARWGDLLRLLEAPSQGAPLSLLRAVLELALEGHGARVEDRGHALRVRLPAGAPAWPVVAAARELLEDGARFEELVTRGRARLDAEAEGAAATLAARAVDDPLFALDEDGVQDLHDSGELDDDGLRRLARHPDEAVRLYLFELPDAVTLPARELLARDESAAVRRAAAVTCEGLSEGALRGLAQDTAVEVRATLAENRGCPPEVLARLAEDPSERVRVEVASNRSTPRGTVQRLAEDPSGEVREWAQRGLARPSSP